MLKNLQLYTIVIVLVVIVLSQFTLLGEPGSAALSGTNGYSSEKETNKVDKVNKLIKDSKYAEPLAEVTGSLDELNKTVGKFKGSVKEVKEMLDIEKSLGKLSDTMR